MKNLSEKLFEYRIFAGQSSAVHQEKQFEASAKIFDKYRIIPEESREVHKDLFFIHKSQKSKIENKATITTDTINTETNKISEISSPSLIAPLSFVYIITTTCA